MFEFLKKKKDNKIIVWLCPLCDHPINSHLKNFMCVGCGKDFKDTYDWVEETMTPEEFNTKSWTLADYAKSHGDVIFYRDVNEDFKRFFTIGENHISTIIPTEQDALNQIKRLTNILNMENGFYNEFSASYDGRILTYITLYYPNLLDQSTYLIQKFRIQNLEIYQKFFTGDKNINYKFLMSGIISDMYHIDNVIVNTLDFIRYFYPTPLNKTSYQDKLQQTREFLLEILEFTNDGNIIETLRNYDIVCWYYFNSVIKNPNITLSKEAIEEIIVIQTTTFPLFKDDIKRRYGIE